MSKFDDQLAVYRQEAQKLGVAIDDDLLNKVTKGLGPSIYNADSMRVSATDGAEIDRVKANFLVKKLGLPNDQRLDSLISEVINTLGASNPNKYRALFYYLLVKKAGKESVY